MAEAQSRSSNTRGRGSGRAGRGGYSSRGGRQSSSQKPSNGDTPTALPMVSLEDQGEIGQLKKKHASQLDLLRELFPEWTDDDLVLALEESDGDMERTAEKISEGNVSQFSDVKKKTKEKSKTPKDASVATETTTSAPRTRGRGAHESSRGARGRGTERPARSRGGRGGSSSAPRTVSSTQASAPTAETNGWGDSTATTGGQTDWADSSNAATGWDQPTTTSNDMGRGSSETARSPDQQKSSLIPEGAKKSWAKMAAGPDKILAQKAAAAQAASVSDGTSTMGAPIESGPGPTATGTPAESESLLAPPDGTPSYQATSTSDVAETTPAASTTTSDSAANLTPPRDQLTEDNLENLPDTSQPPPTETVASTRDGGSAGGTSTPYAGASQATSSARPPMGGYATTAWKATGAPGRSASYQKRMMEQREAVVMPGNHAVDRTAVQFGSMGIDGDSKPLDVDNDREEAQTRAPAAQSPPTQPRTSLPPMGHQAQAAQDMPVQDNLPTPRQAPGFPMASQPPSTSIAGPSPSQSSAAHHMPQSAQQYGQYGRYGAAPIGQETSVPSSKPYDPFSQQLNYPPTQMDSQSGYGAQSHPAHLQQGQSQGQAEGYGAYGAPYGAEQQRNAHAGYYGGGYGQQNTNAQQEQQMGGPQRTGSAFANAESSYAGSQSTATQSRFTENQASGHTTPNPTMASQQQLGHQQQQMHHSQGHHQSHTGQSSGYGYQNPYYGGSYYGSYMNQYPNSYYNQQGYSAPYGGKNNMYGQPHHGYGISPQTSYDQSASPANANAYANNMRGNENSLTGGLGDYGRSGSAQASQQSTSGAGGYSSHMADAYGRGAGGYGQAQYGSQGDEALKPFNESKAGPSPSMGQPGRTGSAANSGYGGNQTNFPPPGTQQQGYGGYPSHLSQMHNNQGSGYGGAIGGLGGHQSSAQSHQQSAGYGGYAGYGGNNSNSYNYGGRGWGGSYGH